MEINLFKDDFVRMYSSGIEKSYKGKSVFYDDDCKTLIYYYYYKRYKKLYVVDGKEACVCLPNVNGGVRVIAAFENSQVSLFNKYLKAVINNKKIFYMNDDFFTDIMIELKGKKASLSNIALIYNYHTGQDGYKNIDNLLFEKAGLNEYIG